MTGLVFSKNRAMQLAAFLTSFYRCCKDNTLVNMHVLYKADEKHERSYTILEKEFPGANSLLSQLKW